MRNTAYRLAEYKIIENEHGDLWWESHIGLGSLKSGKCFINGDILFIKPSDSTGPGFLKGEFLDHLKKLPKWKKTKYYCASYQICECKSGSRKLLFDGLDSRLQNEVFIGKNGSTQRDLAKTEHKAVKADTREYICYKLGRYEIIEKNNGQLFWKSHSSLVSSKAGRCYVKGNILFLESGEAELSSLNKKDFMRELIHLPKWEKTEYFCPRYTIYYTRTGAICRSLGENKGVNITGTKNIVVNIKTFGVGKSIKPTILNKIIAKDELTTFFTFLKILVMFILRILFKCFQLIYKVIRVLTGKRTQVI